MKFNSLTPVLFVEAIEPCLEFWKKLEFQTTAEVPEGNRLGFVILARDGVQLMYQTRDSLRNDVPAFADQKFESCNPLYFIVDDLNDVERRLAGVQKVMPRRDTFYGATEFSVREPGGYVVCFSEHKQH
jgi:hypothetical protein